jgi:hypothetical protein
MGLPFIRWMLEPLLCILKPEKLSRNLHLQLHWQETLQPPIDWQLISAGDSRRILPFKGCFGQQFVDP